MVDQFNDEKLKHDITEETSFDDIDAASNRGMIGTSEQVGKLRSLDIDPNTGRKKKSLVEELLSLDAWQKAMDDLVAQINEKLDDLKQSLKISERLRNAQKDGDIDELRIVLSDQGINVSGMNREQILEAAESELELQTLKQETLIQEIQDLAVEYKNHLKNENIPDDQKQIYVHKLAAMRLKAEGITNVDFDGAFKESFKLDSTNELYGLGNDSLREAYDPFTLTDGFNQKSLEFNEIQREKRPVKSIEEDLNHANNPDLLSGLSFN